MTKIVVVGAQPGYGASFVGCLSSLEARVLSEMVHRRGKSMLVDTMRAAGYDVEVKSLSEVYNGLKFDSMFFDEAVYTMPKSKRKPKPYYNKSRW